MLHKKESDIHSLYLLRVNPQIFFLLSEPLEQVDKPAENFHKVIKIRTDVIHKRHTLHHIHLFHLFLYSKFVHIYNNRCFYILQGFFEIFFNLLSLEQKIRSYFFL